MTTTPNDFVILPGAVPGTSGALPADDLRALVGYVEQRDARPCAGGCGLGREPGDIFCEGCRDGHNRDVALAGPDER